MILFVITKTIVRNKKKKFFLKLYKNMKIGIKETGYYISFMLN